MANATYQMVQLALAITAMEKEESAKHVRDSYDVLGPALMITNVAPPRRYGGIFAIIGRDAPCHIVGRDFTEPS